MQAASEEEELSLDDELELLDSELLDEEELELRELEDELDSLVEDDLELLDDEEVGSDEEVELLEDEDERDSLDDELLEDEDDESDSLDDEEELELLDDEEVGSDEGLELLEIDDDLEEELGSELEKLGDEDDDLNSLDEDELELLEDEELRDELDELDCPEVPEGVDDIGLVESGHSHGPKLLPSSAQSWMPDAPPRQEHEVCAPGTHAFMIVASRPASAGFTPTSGPASAPSSSGLDVPAPQPAARIETAKKAASLFKRSTFEPWRSPCGEVSDRGRRGATGTWLPKQVSCPG